MNAKFNIEGMSCSACSASVEKAVGRLKGITSVNVNLLTNTMVVNYDENSCNDEIIIEAVRKAGFGAVISEADKKEKSSKDSKTSKQNMKIRLSVSIIFLILLLYISMGHMINLPLPSFMHEHENGVVFATAQLIFLLPILYVNRKFFTVGFNRLIKRAPNMDSLVAIGSSAAFIYGLFSIVMIAIANNNHDADMAMKYLSNLYFESAGMILTLVTVGKYLEERSKGKTSLAIKHLIDFSPKTAVVIRNDSLSDETPVEITIPVEEIVVGDIIIVKPGGKIPADGVVIFGSSSVDQSALTGESVFVEKQEGDLVMCASINKNGYMKIRATKVGKDTTFSQIIELVENAGATKAPIARLADKVSGVFVPIVMGISVLSVIIWLLTGATFDFALSAGISVLVISCPCALGLATPVAIMVATGRCAEKGILIKSAEALEIMHSVQIVVMDKTGTVTEGNMSVVRISSFSSIDESELLQIAASIETQSEHPIAKAIVSYAQTKQIETTMAENFTAISGRGISADYKGTKYFAGNKAFMKELKIDMDKDIYTTVNFGTPLYIANSNGVIGVLEIADTIKPTSKEAIEKLKKMKIEVVLLSGDNRVTAEAIGAELLIDRVISEVLPQDKDAVIIKLQSENKVVAMVGDGINDAPALTRANVGIAIGNGTDIAIESADVVLINNDLKSVAEAINFGKKTIRNIKQNLFWAFFYNTLGIPVAAGLLYPIFGIMLSPMIAAAAMSFSSIFVVTNALRLGRK